MISPKKWGEDKSFSSKMGGGYQMITFDHRGERGCHPKDCTGSQWWGEGVWISIEVSYLKLIINDRQRYFLGNQYLIT